MLDAYVTRKACNIYLLYNQSREAILVDPGFNEGGKLVEHINKLNLKIVAILLTHSHFDHIDALEDICKLYPDVKVYINEDEAELLDNATLNLSRFRDDGIIRNLTYHPKHLVKLGDNEEFSEAGYLVKMIKTPFHTKGSACYYVKSENILFSGDTLFYTTIGRTDLPTGSNRDIESSLKKLLTLPLETKIYPGHGVATSLERESKYNTYLRNI